MTKTKILYGIESADGGSWKHLVYLVMHLKKEDFEITIIYSDSRKGDIKMDLDRMAKKGVILVCCHSMVREFNFIKDLKVFFFLCGFINKNKFDIVHAHSSKAGFLFRITSRLKGVKKIFYTPHCFYFQSKKGFIRYLFKFYEIILSKISTKIIVSESECKAAIENKIANKDKFQIINNAIYFEEYDLINFNKKSLKEFGIKEDHFIVGSVGRLTQQKDWETYILTANEVLKKHPKTVFLIVGDGEQEIELKNFTKKLNLSSKVIFTGFVKDIHKIYGIMDVFVSTSIWDGLPYVFLEAMAHKKAIITTNSCNQDLIVNDQSAFLCPVKNYGSISDKIISLIENRKIAVLMGEKGNKLLETKYSFKLFIKKHSKLYNEESQN